MDKYIALALGVQHDLRMRYAMTTGSLISNPSPLIPCGQYYRQIPNVRVSFW